MRKSLLIFKILLCLAILAGFFYISAVRIDTDYWWHLKVGERILDNKAVPHEDIYSNSMPGYRWVDHEWLIDAALSWLNSHGLSKLIALIFSLLAALPFLIWIIRANSLEIIFASFLGAFSLIPFIGIRPQIISFALFFILFEILRERYCSNTEFRTSKFFIGILLYFFVWANLHGGFFSGLVILGLFIFLNYFQLWLKNMKIYYRHIRYDTMFFSGALLVALINPYGIDLYREVFRVMFSYETQRYIVEWRPGLDYPYIGLIVFVGLFLFLLIQFVRYVPLSLSAPAIFFAFLYVKSLRQAPFFVIAALPFVEAGLSLAKQGIISAYRKKPFRELTKKMLKVLAAVLFAGTVFSFSYFAFKVYGNNYYYPTRAVQILKEEIKKEKVVLMNYYGWGGYIIFNAPEIKVFIDGRMPHWVDEKGNSAMKDYVRVYYTTDRNAVSEVFKKYGINTALIKKDYQGVNGNVTPLDENIISQMLRSNPFLGNISNRIANLLLPFQKVNDVRAILEKRGWKILYEDNDAVLMRCYAEACY